MPLPPFEHVDCFPPTSDVRPVDGEFHRWTRYPPLPASSTFVWGRIEMIRVDPPPPSLGQLRLPLYEWDIKDFFCAWSVNILAVDYVSVLFCVTRSQREDTVARIGDTKMGWLVCLPTDHTDDLPFSSAQFKDHLGAPPSDATVIEPTDRAHETFQARSRCRTRARLSLTLVFLPPSPLDRTGWCIDSIHARRVVILVFGHPIL